MALSVRKPSSGSVLAAWGVSAMSLVLLAVTCLVMIWAYMQQYPLRQVDGSEIPSRVTMLDDPEIIELRNHLEKSPGDDAIKARIRDLDVSLRTEFFHLQKIRNFGAYILVGSLVALVFSLKLLAGLYTKLPMPIDSAPADVSARRLGFWARIFVGMVAAGIFAGAISLYVVSAPGFSLVSDDKLGPLPAPSATAEQAKNSWPRFRGPGGSGHWPGEGIPTRFDGRTGENILWKVPIELPGRNSAIVYGNRVIVTGADKSKSMVYCFDADTGRLAWEAEVRTDESRQAGPVDVWEDVWAANTAATDGKVICAIFPTGDVACFDFNGNKRWTKYFQMSIAYGHASSLVIHDGQLLIQK
ncbi:MAG TPA: hypothetical protein ENL03_02235, partial [Phycisphaerae bacterium]|nr:hypothetical protein [Phycisphaerae bacterium]